MAGSPLKRARKLALEAAGVTENGELADLRAARAALGIAPYVAEMNLNLSAFGPDPLYEPRFCQTVLDDAARGHTLTATAALLGVAPQTLYDWQDRYPEFAHAVMRARAVRLRYLEGLAIDTMRRGGDSTKFSAVKLGLANASDDWREKPAGDVNLTFNLAALVTEALKVSSAPPALAARANPSPNRE